MTRDESLEILKEKLNEKEMRKVITQGYSDVSLSVMAKRTTTDARDMADSLFTIQSINKLCDAYTGGLIDVRDFDLIIEISRFQRNHEKYLDEFLDSIKSDTLYHSTATNAFVSLAYEECTYAKAVAMIKAEVYYPTEYGSLSLEADVAKELERLAVPLRACEGFNYYYDVDDVQFSLDEGDAIFVKDYDLAVKVKEYMKLPDWEEFRNRVADIIDDYPDRNITGQHLAEMRRQFMQNQYESKLYEKMQGEYDSFIADLKKKSPDEIIDSAYQIVTKKDILDFLAGQSPSLSEKQYAALLSSTNALDEIYETWCTNSEFHGLYDIGLAMEETADDMQYSIDRRNEEQAKKQEQTERKDDPAPEVQQKPKSKAR